MSICKFQYITHPDNTNLKKQLHFINYTFLKNPFRLATGYSYLTGLFHSFNLITFLKVQVVFNVLQILFCKYMTFAFVPFLTSPPSYKNFKCTYDFDISKRFLRFIKFSTVDYVDKCISFLILPLFSVVGLVS